MPPDLKQPSPPPATAWWRPEAFARRRSFLESRARITGDIRRWFGEQGFVEVETPSLQVSPGLEPHLHAFETRLDLPDGRQVARYLHTSPEFAMKKLLVAGMTRIVQIAHVFRNQEGGSRHSPEFTMLEWYRAGGGLADLAADCAELLRLACRAAGTAELRGAAGRCDPFMPAEYLSVQDAFARYCDIDLLATAPDPSKPDLALLAAAAAPLGVAPHDGDRWEDLFFRLMFDRIEPRLGMDRLTILGGYPISMAALARPNPDDPRVALRFELYACGVELANGFDELTEAELQRSRFEADMALKQELYGRRYPIDEDFLAALTYGMPPAAGIALGLDRLVMLATHAPDLDSVLWTPVDSVTGL